mmetsp:Transcript_7814/g.32603  ORF Transcript_7814/g.32603 Transcript_7814/m.32603 type:complete len:409 (-) Transcript_7814:1954-3180(-)
MYVSVVTSTSQEEPNFTTDSLTSGMRVSIATVNEALYCVTYSTRPDVGYTKGTAPATRSASMDAVELRPVQSVSEAPNLYRSPGLVFEGSRVRELKLPALASATIRCKSGCSSTPGTVPEESAPAPAAAAFGETSTESKLQRATPSQLPSAATACRLICWHPPETRAPAMTTPASALRVSSMVNTTLFSIWNPLATSYHASGARQEIVISVGSATDPGSVHRRTGTSGRLLRSAYASASARTSRHAAHSPDSRAGGSVSSTVRGLAHATRTSPGPSKSKDVRDRSAGASTGAAPGSPYGTGSVKVTEMTPVLRSSTPVPETIAPTMYRRSTGVTSSSASMPGANESSSTDLACARYAPSASGSCSSWYRFTVRVTLSPPSTCTTASTSTAVHASQSPYKSSGSFATRA